MYSKAVLLIAMCTIMHFAAGSVIREKQHMNEDYSVYFKTLASYRQRLQIEGLFPKSKKLDISSINVQNFDELEVLQLVPVTIKQLRQHKLSSDELVALQKIFGSFWDLIEEDAHRKRSEPRSDLLSDLLSSREIRFGKQEIRNHLKNDLKGNSVQMVYNPDNSRTIKFSHEPGMEPSQRLLRMVAAICQQVYRERPAQKTRNKRSDSIKLENVEVTIKVPRAKRSLYSGVAIKRTAGLTSAEERHIDDANEAAIMEAVLAQIGNNGLDDDDDDADDNSSGVEDDDDYYEDDDDYLVEHEPTETVKASGEKVENVDGWASGENNGLEGHSPDYAYDESGVDDDYFMTDFKPRFSPGDFENPSINELIMLAARHHARKRADVIDTGNRFRTASSETEDDKWW
ncbi:uncharacterized protein LOC135706362 [Ochlerotatus camptorhynchus]|uniref:uncharacterized protein LOC135706362 n=1 Tax=Ochlerotatus camptorhynchus TaxID=644619 RepID=UPI0031D70FBA